MLQEAVLDLARADAVAARRDDVVVAADEAQVTLVVQAALVAGHQPVAAELGGRGLRIAPVFEKHHRKDRKSVVSGKSVSVRVALGGRRLIKKKTRNQKYAP